MASISSMGIGSGLPLDTLLTNLTTAEKGRLTPISTQQSAYTAKLSAYGSLKSALTSFQTANSAINTNAIFQSTTATSSATDAFTATTEAGAATGKYSVAVTQLAQAQSLLSGKVDSSTSNLGTSGAGPRTLTISQPGQEKPLEIKLTDAQSTLTGIRDAINNADSSVNASIIKVDDKNYQLVVTSAETGEKNTMTLSVSGDAKLQSFIGYDASTSSNGMSQTVSAQNALLSVNGVDIERESNTITDAPQGVTLTLLNKTTDTQSLTIAKDTSKASTAIKAWVDAYNALQDSFSNLTAYTAVDAGAEEQSSSNGALLGDSTLRTIQTQLKNQLTNAASSSTYKTLSQIGITSNPTTGKLVLDSDKLSTALSNDAKGVMAMINGDGKSTGISTTINNSITRYLATDGILTNATNGVSQTLKSLTAQYNKTNDSINDAIARYKEQFTQLDVLMNKLNSTSNYLASQFTTSNSSSSSSS